MGLSGLDSALSGLRVAQQQMSVISNNIANVNTAGYTRKILPQQTQAVGGQSVGVISNPIIRNVDLNLSRDFWTQVSSVESINVKMKYLDRIQQFHGPPDSEVSVAAELAQLRDRFAALADSPEDVILQRTLIDQAVLVSDKMNDLSDMLTQMRNDTQDEIAIAVQTINDRLEQIAELNAQVKFNRVSGKSTAALEDSRDQAISELSELIGISFFTRGDGVLVVQTENGVQLADERPEVLFFEKANMDAQSYYPESASGIFVGGDPAEVNTAIDITSRQENGKLGGLFELRDEILPRHQALLDEMAHQMTRRFDAQGLRLFTDPSGNIPSDTAPDPTTIPLPTAVEYVGFSAVIQVNQDILDNNSLLQTGTVATDLPVQSGSNEVIRRAMEFVFGNIEFQEAIGTVDLDPATLGTALLQDGLGLYSSNSISSRIDLTNITDVSTAIGNTLDLTDAAPDSFDINFAEPLLGLNDTITIDFEAVALHPGTAAQQLVTEINIQLAALPADPRLAASASINGDGQLVIESRGDMEIIAGTVGDDTLSLFGLETGFVEKTDPFFQIQMGNDPLITITIDADDDLASLFDKLDHNGTGLDVGVPGLAVNPDLLLGPPATLELRPGDDFATPTFGGDIKIIGGPFETAGNVPIIEALFGTGSPVVNVDYSSPTFGGGTTTFRSNDLGPAANINTGIISSNNLIDYAQKMINAQVLDRTVLDSQLVSEESFKELLQTRQLNDSGVNIEEELANLIRIQTAFSAAARVVQAIDQEFRELLNAI